MESEKGLNIEPFTDALTFSLGGVVSSDVIEELSEADPSVKEYEDLMLEMKIRHRRNIYAIKERLND